MLIPKDYWEGFELNGEDIEFLYHHLLEIETPQTSAELLPSLISSRIVREIKATEIQRKSSGKIYLPEKSYAVGDNLVFPALEWKKGKVTAERQGFYPDQGSYTVLELKMETGETKEFASQLANHPLNLSDNLGISDPMLDLDTVMHDYSQPLTSKIEEDLESHPDFVRIAGRWFPKALLVDINIGHINLADAVLDMNNGGPMETPELIKEVGLTSAETPKLLEFSFDLALQEDDRFDEVGPAGIILWYLNRAEPQEVLKIPLFLQYKPSEYDRSILSKEMLALERELNDELSPLDDELEDGSRVVIKLIYPHIRAGTLPLSTRLRKLFPTAYEAPRIRFILVDESSGEKFPAWVVCQNHYVFGLREWYQKKGLIPGSLVSVSTGDQPGEVVLGTLSRRSSKEWIKTVLIGADGGVVFSMLKQIIEVGFDDRMSFYVTNIETLDTIWEESKKRRRGLEYVFNSVFSKLAGLNPQGNVHFSELYSAINIIHRCPPGPIMATLETSPDHIHVGDLYFRKNP